MIVLNKITPLTALLVIICLTLITVVWLEIPDSNEPEANHLIESDPVHREIVEYAENENISMPNIENYNEFSERPLFSETRRLVDAQAESEQTQTFDDNMNESVYDLEDYVLIGIVLTNDTQVAYMVDSKTYELQKLVYGDRLGEWSISEITPNSVVFEGRSGEAIELLLWQEPFQIQQPSDNTVESEGGHEIIADEFQKNVEEEYISEGESGEAMDNGEEIETGENADSNVRD